MHNLKESILGEENYSQLPPQPKEASSPSTLTKTSCSPTCSLSLRPPSAHSLTRSPPWNTHSPSPRTTRPSDRPSPSGRTSRPVSHLGPSSRVVVLKTSSIVGTGVNSTISGPLLNATLVSLTFREQTYNSTESGAPSYSASQASALYITADGQVVDYQQSGTAASNGQVQSLVGPSLAFLLRCVKPIP